MSMELDQALQLASAQTFEELCCAFVEPWPVAEPVPPLTHGAAVAFSGPRHGWLELRVSSSTLIPLAAAMLADDEPPPLLQQDAVGELANVICGNLLPAVAGYEAVFRLGAPAPLPEATSVPAASLLLQIDSGAAELRLHFAEATA